MASITKSRRIFASRLKQYRQSKGLTQEELASVTGLTSTYLSSLERGRVNISLDNADAIAGALGVPLAVLLIDDAGENN